MVILQGDPTLSTSLVSLKAMWKALRETGEGVLAELGHIGVMEPSLEVSPPAPIQRILDQFQGLFQSPLWVPPRRTRDLIITLQSGPVNVRPYHYPQIQKAEIERLVKEMLTADIIQPSTSQYSSHVLLVRKKGRSWHFCVDYHVLNKATIPDKFPIPFIDELLDELYGASIFSKLDLRSSYHQIRV